MTSVSSEEDFATENYGLMPLIQSKENDNRQLLSLRDINETLVQQVIWIRGRFHTSRDCGKKCFFYYSSSIGNNTSSNNY